MTDRTRPLTAPILLAVALVGLLLSGLCCSAVLFNGGPS